MKATKASSEENFLARFNCGPVKLTGAESALYERHLTFDQVIPVATARPRDRFEAIAHSIRDCSAMLRSSSYPIIWLSIRTVLPAFNGKHSFWPL